MISEFGSKLPFGFLVIDSKRVIRISGFSSIPPGLVSIISGFLGQLKLVIPLRRLVGEEMLEGMLVSAVDFIREIKWESVLSIRWRLEE